jgi:hypothetical protein
MPDHGASMVKDALETYAELGWDDLPGLRHYAMAADAIHELCKTRSVVVRVSACTVLPADALAELAELEEERRRRWQAVVQAHHARKAQA